MKKLTAAEKREQKAEAIKELRTLCPPGTTVYTVLHAATRSGMSRTLTAFVIELDQWTKKHKPYKINHLLWKIGVANRTDDLTLRVPGIGVDMGFMVVRNMASAIYPDDAEARKSIKQEWL